MTSFAEKLGVTRQNLYNILKNPSYPTLENIANHLEVPMWQLFASQDEVIEGRAKEENMQQGKIILYQPDKSQTSSIQKGRLLPNILIIFIIVVNLT